MRVIVKKVLKKFGKRTVLKQLSFNVESGQWASIVGVSGSGKSTLMNIISGVLEQDSGLVRIGDFPTREKRAQHIGYLAQDYPLYPSLKVKKNLLLALSKARSDIGPGIDELVSVFKIDRVLESFPYQLSGGERQRVSLARTLLLRRGILLLDEPFSNIDVVLRQDLRRYVRKIQKENGWTVILVTHDQEDAISTSNIVGYIDNGILTQVDTPFNLFYSPVSPKVAANLGDVSMQIFDCKIMKKLGIMNVAHNNNKIKCGVRETDFDVEFIQTIGYTEFKIVGQEFLGSRQRLHLKGHNLNFTVVVSKNPKNLINYSCWVKVKNENIYFFNESKKNAKIKL